MGSPDLQRANNGTTRTKSRYEGGAPSSGKKDNRVLAQTIDYEDVPEGTYSDNDYYTEESAQRSGAKRGSIPTKPIFVRDEPVLRPRVPGGQRPNNGKVFVSGDSFGPLNRSSSGLNEKILKGKQSGINYRDKIDENFLEDDDDLAESGEINPAMFR